MSRFVREGPVTVQRTTPRALDKSTGRYSEEKVTTQVIRGSLQPITGEDLKKLPDGYRIFDVKVLFAHVRLKEDDIIVWREDKYRIEHKEEWEPEFSPIPHYRYILVKEKIR